MIQVLAGWTANTGISGQPTCKSSNPLVTFVAGGVSQSLKGDRAVFLKMVEVSEPPFHDSKPW